MTLFYRDERVSVYHGDCLDILPTLPAGSVHAVITDPPYGLEFMGKDWDSFGRTREYRPRSGYGNSGILPHYGRGGHPADVDRFHRRAHRAFGDWCLTWAEQCLRVLPPGGHLLAFGGSRTWHRLACALEDAGFEIRDTIAWLYGSGFPKSLNVSHAIDKATGVAPTVIGPPPYTRGRARQSYNATRRVSYDYPPGPITAPTTAQARRWHGWGTGLKRAFEPFIVARKPLSGTVAATVVEHGTRALNIDGCRVPAQQRPARVGHHSDTPGKSTYGAHGPGGGSHAAGFTDQGRWPANVVLSHLDGCAERCVPGCPVAALDEQSGLLRSGANPHQRHAPIFRDCYGTFDGHTECVPARDADAGGASRFFPAFRWQAKASRSERPRVDGITHPTVKPLALVRWLACLVTPPGGVILDPFLGSGTTAEAARAEGFSCVGIERDATYLPLITARLSRDDTGAHLIDDRDHSGDAAPEAAA
jgi:site-specific DNA-methyltransferase (adenine-specific)